MSMKTSMGVIQEMLKVGVSTVLGFALSFCHPHSCPICIPGPNCTWTRNHKWRNCSSPIRALSQDPGLWKQQTLTQSMTVSVWSLFLGLKLLFSFSNILHIIKKNLFKRVSSCLPFPSQMSPAWRTHWTWRPQNIISHWSKFLNLLFHRVARSLSGI